MAVAEDAIPGNLETQIHKSYAEWILVFFKVYHRLFFTPFQIKRNGKTGLYEGSNGRRTVKLGFAVGCSLVAIYTLWGITISAMHDNFSSGIMNGLYKLNYVFYGLFNIIWAHFMWKHVPAVPSILNKGNDLYTTVLHADQTPIEGNSKANFISTSRKPRIPQKFIRWISVICIFLLTTVSTLSFYTQGIADRGHMSLAILANHAVNRTIVSFCRIHEVGCSLLLNSESEQPNLLSYIVTSIWILITIYSELPWQSMFFMMIGWAIYFRTLLKYGLQKIRNSVTDAEIYQAAQIFSKIIFLLDEWNEIFGPVLLINFMNILLYKCVSFTNVMASGLGVIHTGMLLVEITPFFVMLYYMADAHRVGGSVATIWKEKYIICKRYPKPLSPDILHISMVFHYDVLANTCSFKGCNFFNVSFHLVGNLIGVITTYTLVMFQLTSVK